jgi:hypothetical protein
MWFPNFMSPLRKGTKEILAAANMPMAITDESKRDPTGTAHRKCDHSPYSSQEKGSSYSSTQSNTLFPMMGGNGPLTTPRK